MSRFLSPSQKGSVLLVALCFVTVLGISLASYIAVCSRTMQVSNRTAQASLSRQLAEMGLEEALRAFNKDDWSSWSNGPVAVWTTSGTTATCNLTFPAGTFGQGLTGSVKIRVDNYNANQLDSIWSSSANYRLNDVVGYSGSWYRCVLANSNQVPAGLNNMAYWVPHPAPAPLWDSTFTYKAEDVVYYTSTNSWYRCILAPTSNQTPSNATYWLQIPVISTDNNLYYTNYALLNYFGTWYQYLTATGWDNQPPVSWRWRSSPAVNYAFNDLVCYNNTWYRCKIAHTSSGTIPPTNTAFWEVAPSGMSGWSSSISYNLGDVVYYGSSWYRCILANSNKTPSSYPANWSTYPLLSRNWRSGRQYSQNDTVRYNGVWYLSLQSSNTGQNPATAATYWIGANTSTSSYQWNTTTAYASGDYRCYGGAWYKCISPNTGQSPNNTTYWTASWANSFGVTTGAPVAYAEGTVNIPGSASIKTQLRATLAPSPLFPNAAAANSSTITANSGGTVDSYDSTSGTVASQGGGTVIAGFSNSGTYAGQVNTATNYSAVVASSYSAGTAITLSSTDVKGYLAAPSTASWPYAPQYSSGGTVKGPSSPGSPNIDLTRISRSPYIPKFDTIPGGAGGLAANWATTPKGTLLSLPGTATGTANIGTPGDTVPSRYYYSSSLTIGGASIQYLNINGPVILYINGDLFITNSSGNNGRINLSSTGSAEIHVTGAFKADAGGEGILSYTSDPKSLIIISDTTNTTTQFYSEGVDDLYGVIYMPYSTSTTGYYNNNNNTEIFGAISANKITYSGANMNIHYDTSLRYATFGGVDQPYAITEWRELTDASELATMP